MADSDEPEPQPSPDASEGDPTRGAITRWVRKTQRFKRPGDASTDEDPQPEPASDAPAVEEAPQASPRPAPEQAPDLPEVSSAPTVPAEPPVSAEPPASAAPRSRPKTHVGLQFPAPSPSKPHSSRKKARAARGPQSKTTPASRTKAPTRGTRKAATKASSKRAGPAAPPKGARPAFSTLRARMQHGVSASPAFAFATLFHALLLLVLSMFTVARYVDEAPKEIEVALRSQTRIDEAALPEPRETVASLIKTPPVPAQIDLQQDHQQAAGSISGPAAQDTSVLFGLEGSGGKAKGEGGAKTQGAQGPSAASDGARDAGLEWLSRHRTSEGAWGVVELYHRPGDWRSATSEVGRTGLSVLAFLAAGHSPITDGPYRELLSTARDWLVRRCRPNGLFDSPGQAHHLYYQQAIGTLALAELASLDPKHEGVRKALQRSVDLLEKRRGRWGWRYPESPPAWNGDTSVNTWVALALRSAGAAKARVSEKNFRVLKRFLERVTSSDGRTGYVIRGRDATDAMNASGLFLRIMLGESPTSKRNTNAVRLVTYAGGPREVDGGIYNLYGIYYASLALYQVGGEPWEAFNPIVRDGLVAMQEHAPGCELGSWLPGGYLGQDRVLGTAFATLTLETYYRYLPTHDGVAQPDAGEEPTRESPGETALAAATQALRDAKADGNRGDLLAVEAKLGVAAEALSADPTLNAEEQAALLTLCRERLVAVAVLAKDSPLALQRAQDYMDELPAGMPPSGAVLSVLVEERFLQLVRRTSKLLEARKPVAADLHAQLAAIQAFVDDPPSPELPPSTRKRLPMMLDALSAQRAELVFRLPPLAAQDLAERWVRGADPNAERPPSALELRWGQALREQAERGYRSATEQGDERAFARAEAARATLGTRKLAERRSAPGQARAKRADVAMESLRIHALLSLGRLGDAASAARVLGDRYPSQRSNAESFERKALAELRQSGELSAQQLERYRALLSAWAKARPESSAERLALATELRAVEAKQPAQVLFRSLRDDPDTAIRDTALIALASMAREAGNFGEARGWLEACQPRVGVRLELARLAIAEGRTQVALEGYVSLLHALQDLDRARWWEVAEELAHAYRDLGLREEAFDFADGLRRRDPEFGGDPARKRRLLDLLREVM